jgi:hypothetical protein
MILNIAELVSNTTDAALMVVAFTKTSKPLMPWTNNVIAEIF